MTLISTSALFIATHRALLAGRYVEAAELLAVLRTRADVNETMLLDPLGVYIAHNGKHVKGAYAVNLHDGIYTFNNHVRRASSRPPAK